MYNSSSNNGRKVIASIVAILVAVAIIGAAILVLRTPASAGTVTNVTENKISEEEINEIVEKYLSEHPSTLSEEQVRAIFTQLIAEYDALRFDEDGHCRCCGEHVVEVDRSTHTHDTQYIDRTVTQYIDRTVTQQIPANVDLSGYYSREEVDAIIIWLLGQINNGKGGSEDPGFVQPDPGFESQDPGFIPPEEGHEGEGAGETATESTFIDPNPGHEGDGTVVGNDDNFIPPQNGTEGEGAGAATESTFIPPQEGHEGDQVNGQATSDTFVNPSEGNENNGADQVTGQTFDLTTGSNAASNSDFINPSEGTEGEGAVSNTDDFVAPSNGSEGAVGTTEEAFVAPHQGYENDSDNEGEGQTIDLTTGGNNTASNDDFVLPNPGVEFSGVDNSNPSEGFIPPAAGTGYGE